MAGYTEEQIHEAIRRADAAGDGEAVRALAAALQRGAGRQEILDTARQHNATVDEAALDANIASRDAGGPTSGFFERPAVVATQNALAGAAQGALGGIVDFPMDISRYAQQGVNALLKHSVGGALDFAGLEGAADWWQRGADANANQLANQPTAAGLIEHISPTPEGMGASRLTAQVLGGLAVPIGPKAAPRVTAPRAAVANPAREVVEAGEREGVRVMTSDVSPPTTFTGKIARAAGERIPYVGTGGPRAAQLKERAEAVRNLAREYGVDGTQIDDVAGDLARTRGGRITALKARKDRVIDGVQGTLPPAALTRTLGAIDAQIQRLTGIDAEAFKPVIDRLTAFGANIASGKTLRQIEGNRKLLGDMFEDVNLAAIKGDGQKALNAIYAPLRDDMGAFIQANAGDDALNAWKQSNDELAAMAGELDARAFRNVLQNAETTPENVASLLFSKKPSDVRRLYANLSQAGQSKAQAAVIYEAIRRAGGIEDISPQRFANVLRDFGRTTGIIFGNDAPRIEGLVRLLKATQRSSEAAAAPPTGVQSSQFVGGASLVALLGPWWAAGVSGVAGLAARLYESAPVRNLLLKLGKTQPGSNAESAVLQRLNGALMSQSELRAGPQAANDNLARTVGAAAGDQNGQE